jgi:hypothetical protein
MNLDNKKIDEAVLALLYLGLHDGGRAWKGFDWETMHRLHDQGYISDPRGKAKSVVFTEEGLQRAERLLQNLFGKHAEPDSDAFVAPTPVSLQPRDEWERQLLGLAKDCGVSLPDWALSREAMYE